MARRVNPKLTALRERADRERVDFERNYAKLKRAFNRCEKARSKLQRLQRQIALFDVVTVVKGGPTHDR